MFWIIVAGVIGVGIGVIFHASISKGASKVKATTKEVVADAKEDLDKAKQKI